MPNLPYQKTAHILLSRIEPRTRDILVKRFGLESFEPYTLERIGQEHRITRERVRQIVESAMVRLKKDIEANEIKPVFWQIVDFLLESLKNFGNLKREDLFLEEVRGTAKSTYVIFFLNLGDQFLRHRETDEIHSFWTHNREILEYAPKILQDFYTYFEEKKEVLPLEELHSIHRTAKNISLSSLLEISKRIGQTYDGRWGLKDWPYVNPRTIRDKAYLALIYAKKPLHFRIITKVIQDLQEKLILDKKKPILEQTVHNELIKDPRFVLVGRGLYALAEWGYKPGTVKEIIAELLDKVQKPLTKEEILKSVLKQRQVKANTVLLALQDSTLFTKDELGRYYLK